MSQRGDRRNDRPDKGRPDLVPGRQPAVTYAGCSVRGCLGAGTHRRLEPYPHSLCQHHFEAYDGAMLYTAGQVIWMGPK